MHGIWKVDVYEILLVSNVYHYDGWCLCQIGFRWEFFGQSTFYKHHPCIPKCQIYSSVVYGFLGSTKSAIRGTKLYKGIPVNIFLRSKYSLIYLCVVLKISKAE